MTLLDEIKANQKYKAELMLQLNQKTEALEQAMLEPETKEYANRLAAEIREIERKIEAIPQ